MSIYWIIFALPVLFGLGPIKIDRNLKITILWLFSLILVILIGLRHEIGGDWFRYLEITNSIEPGDFNIAQGRGTIGYKLVQWISVTYLNGIYATNLICAVFFVFGLVRFCKNLPIPWIALMASTPFLIVVVSMGYTRQAAAMGFIMWGLVDLMNERKILFIVSILFAVAFHLTAIVMIPIALIYRKQKIRSIYFYSLSLLVFLVVFIIYSMSSEFFYHMVFYYLIEELHHSDGAIVRVLMNTFFAVLFLFYRRQYRKKYHDEKLWFIFSIISLIMLPLSFLYSTVTDRLAIYFIPIQFIVLSRIPTLILLKYNRTIFILASVIMYSFTLFIWLFFGNHSRHWLPYQNLLTL